MTKSHDLTLQYFKERPYHNSIKEFKLGMQMYTGIPRNTMLLRLFNRSFSKKYYTSNPFFQY